MKNKFPLLTIITLSLLNGMAHGQQKLYLQKATIPSGECSFYSTNEPKTVVSNWDGKCVDGFLDGEGSLKMALIGDTEKHHVIIKKKFNNGYGNGIVSKIAYDAGGKQIYNTTYTESNGFREGFQTGESDMLKHATFKIFWKKDSSVGIGEYSDEGKVYTGEFNNINTIVPSGKGKFVYRGGDWYEGDVLLGQRKGQCKYYSKQNNNLFEGEFDDDNYILTGTLKDETFTATGKWVKEKKQGKFTIYLPNGVTIIGNYKDNLPQGGFSIRFTDGSRYLGNISEDFQMNGNGMLILADGTIQKGEFKNGVYISQPSNGKIAIVGQSYLADTSPNQYATAITRYQFLPENKVKLTYITKVFGSANTDYCTGRYTIQDKIIKTACICEDREVFPDVQTDKFEYYDDRLVSIKYTHHIEYHRE